MSTKVKENHQENDSFTWKIIKVSKRCAISRYTITASMI